MLRYYNCDVIEKFAEDKKATEGFELSISCLLDRRFNQLSHVANNLICVQILGLFYELYRVVL